jgi:hypothetical protein
LGRRGYLGHRQSNGLFFPTRKVTPQGGQETKLLLLLPSVPRGYLPGSVLPDQTKPIPPNQEIGLPWAARALLAGRSSRETRGGGNRTAGKTDLPGRRDYGDSRAHGAQNWELEDVPGKVHRHKETGDYAVDPYRGAGIADVPGDAPGQMNDAAGATGTVDHATRRRAPAAGAIGAVGHASRRRFPAAGAG